MILILVLHQETEGEELLIGYLTGSQRKPGDNAYERPGLTISGAISLAVDEINSELQANGSEHRFRFIVAETMGDEIISIRQTAELWTKNVTVYIGPQETCVHEAKMAAAFNLPMISYYCTNYETSNKLQFPTFARTRPPDTQISKSVASVLLAFNWTQVTFFYRNSSDLSTVADTIVTVLKNSGIVTLASHTWNEDYHHGYSENPFRALVQITYKRTRIYVILGQQDEHLGLLVALDENNLLQNGEYWVVGVGIVQYDETEPTKYLRGLLQKEIEPLCQNAFRSYIAVAPSPAINITHFSIQVNEYMEKPPFNFPNPIGHLGGAKVINAEAAYLYDAVRLYATAVLELLEEGAPWRNGSIIIDRLKGKHYQSAMGYQIFMDNNGDAEGNYTLLARQERRPGECGLYPVGGFSYARSADGLPELQLTSEIDWVSGSVPAAVPICGFSGEKCFSHTKEVILGIAGSAITLILITGLIIYRNWKNEQELDSLIWKIDFKDIRMNEDFNLNGNETKTSRMNHPWIRSSEGSLSSNLEAEFRYSTILTTTCIYKGLVFAVKKIDQKSIDITRAMKKDLKLMKDLRHDNINPFIGACVDAPNICIVTEYCARGSLKDILQNGVVELNNMFIASLVGDILRGLTFLHDSHFGFHGNLKSTNCLVDSRWVVKLSDFGLFEFKKGCTQYEPAWSLKHICGDDREGKCNCEGLLYRAPELLRQTLSCVCIGSQKGDVYSFGIILYELHCRIGPYGDRLGLTPKQIIHRVLCPPKNSTHPFRPPLDQLQTSFDYVKECLIDCWQENPEDRPDIKAIRVKLRPMRKGMKPNIFDNMIAIMETYANNLEALVDERTDQLVEEKKKTEALLYEMLPRCVAEQLKKGHKVEAESFDCVTIFFSDVVGFTAMSAKSTPLQVVDFLNDLYTCFDSIIVNYDVYKVETIGDAYMVVSGLPVRNQDHHAGEIATLSLDLLEAIKSFQIRHRPQDKLQLRIGIHSGPVCAGVVGQKMPRYCLFGDTVNTASRLESTGQAQKIHCSAEVKQLLDRLGGYYIVERGLVNLKGKGDILTYFLEGEDPSYRALRKAVRDDRMKDTHRPFLRSSLKVPCILSRTSSFESSAKRLRFSNKTVEYNAKDSGQKMESVLDNSPPKYINVDICDHLSASCPCIENVQNRINGEKLNETNSDPNLLVNDQICAPLLYNIETSM
ncbi:hypothetical protein O3M35_001368 [Rhynocoris fuscipes]|uniref:Guanylate cyclase n=1 Tax=Rhynocoris fuscipes TaxID=488301 RepID=A0AAW1DRE0_9HEMI